MFEFISAMGFVGIVTVGALGFLGKLTMVTELINTIASILF